MNLYYGIASLLVYCQFLVAFCLAENNGSAQKIKGKKPNIIIIIADDMVRIKCQLFPKKIGWNICANFNDN